MSDAAEIIADVIAKDVEDKLDDIAKYMAQEVQKDFVNVVQSMLDIYYCDYTKENGRKYIRIDELHPTLRANKTKSKHKRGRDISLHSYINSMDADDSPAIGVCRPYGNGYQAGVLFDKSKIGRTEMRHYGKGKGFTEFDIIENFVEGEHYGGGETDWQTQPYVDLFLTNRINNYDNMMQHYFDEARKIYG